MKKRFSEEQIIGFLKKADAGLPVVELCAQAWFFRCLRTLEGENDKLKRLLADPLLDNAALKDVVSRKW